MSEHPESTENRSALSPTDIAPAPETGDLVVDAVLADLAAVDPTDLDGLLAAGESVHATVTSRLSDLGS